MMFFLMHQYCSVATAPFFARDRGLLAKEKRTCWICLGDLTYDGMQLKIGRSFYEGFPHFEVACGSGSIGPRRALADFCAGSHDSENKPIAPAQA
jgi:hypothetical protein